MRTALALLTCFFASLALGAGATTATAVLPVVDQYTEQLPRPDGRGGTNGGGTTPGSEDGGSGSAAKNGSGNSSPGDAGEPGASGSGTDLGAGSVDPSGATGGARSMGPSQQSEGVTQDEKQPALQRASVAGAADSGTDWWFPVLMVGVLATAAGTLIVQHRGKSSLGS